MQNGLGAPVDFFCAQSQWVRAQRTLRFKPLLMVDTSTVHIQLA